MALIKTIDEIKNGVDVSINTRFEDIQPKFDDVENYFIRSKVLGKVLYGDLHAHYNAGTMSAAESNLLPYVQKAVAQFAYAVTFGIINVNISSSGIRQAHTDTMKPAFQWAVEDAKKEIFWGAYRSIEAILVFLEENISDYPEWVSSSAYFLKRRRMVQSALEFDDIEQSIHESRRYYLDALGILTEVEDLVIKNEIGIPYYTDLMNKIKANPIGLNTDDLVVVPMLKNAIVKMTFARSINEMNLTEYEINVTDERAKEAMLAGQAYLAQAKDYLNTNASSSVFPVYFGSSTYKAPPPTAGSLKFFANKKDSNIYVAG